MVGKEYKKNQIAHEYPSISEKNWEMLSVTSAIFTLLIFIVVAVWVFDGGVDKDDLWKVQLFTPFGVALFAVVTYCTANWRGKITTRQADLAASQLHLSERESKAKLLQEGAKLVGEIEKQSHVSAGISTLAVLVMGDDEEFAIQAMNLIADLVQREMGSTHEHTYQEEAFRALKRGASIGRYSDRGIRFKAVNSKIRWKLLHGVKNVTYVGGCFLGLDWKFGLADEKHNFRNVKFEACENVIFSAEFDTCKFNECHITRIRDFWTSREFEVYHEFIDCDFSNALFDDAETLRWIRGQNNYFVEGFSPDTISGEPIDWFKYFSVERHSRMPLLF